MGLDMSSFAEVRNKETGKWELVDKVFPDTVYSDDNILIETVVSEPFNWRSYGMYGFLADKNNYSRVPTISADRGLPQDSEYLNQESPYAWKTNPMSGEIIPFKDVDTIRYDILEQGWGHSHLFLKELLDFNYDQEFEDLRTTKQIAPNCYDGKHVAEPGEGAKTTVRKFLDQGFFKHLEVLKTLGEPEDVRIVIWFS